MITPNNGMPFDVYNTMKATMYGHPNVQPNSEHIKPPIDKQATRVVEPSTRASVNIDLVKKYNEQQDRIEKSLLDIRIRKYLDAQVEINDPNIDLEV